MSSYVPTEYWNRHLSQKPGLLGTGHRRFTLSYNTQMYAVATEQLQDALLSAGVSVAGARILDVGCGFGFYVDKFLGWGASSVTGVDLTQIAVDQLKSTFPGQTFHQGDISESTWHVQGTFDLVSAISMIFHIVDEGRFQTAIRNLCRHTSINGHLLIVDSFQPQWLPSAPHARLRDIRAYRPIMADEGFEEVGLYPMHFVMGRAFIPTIGPALLNLKPVTRLLVAIERSLLGSGLRPGWLNFLILRRTR